MHDQAPVLAVLGGSFDPPHLGHSLLPGWLLAMAGVDRVLVAPCYRHALEKRLSPFEERMRWVRAAMAMYGPRVIVSPVEATLATADPETPSYALRLLEAVASDWPEHRVRLVVGSDIIASGETDRWFRWPEVEARFDPIVVPRAGHARGSPVDLPEVSSSEVRGWWARSATDPGARRALERAVPASVLAAMARPAGAKTLWIVGRGHVGTHAGPWIEARGWRVHRLGARALISGADLPADPPDGVWVLAADPQLPAVADALGRRLPALVPGVEAGAGPVPILHAAGALPAADPRALGILRAAGASVGTLHPICALRAERAGSELSEASFGIEGDPAARALARALVQPQPWLDLQELDAGGRARYHGACALAANMLAVPRTAAARELVELGLPDGPVAAALDTLMRSSLAQLAALGVPAGVTGPLARGDREAARRHEAALSAPAAALYGELAARLDDLLTVGGEGEG